MLRLLSILVLIFCSNFASASEAVVFLKENGTRPAQLVLIDSTVGTEKVLPTGELQVIYPTLTSDGKIVAFSGSYDGRNWGIYTLTLEDHSIREVVPPNGLTIQPSFSGDMKWMAYTAPLNDKNQIHLLNFSAWQANQPEAPQVIETTDAAYYPYVGAAGFQVTFHLSRMENDQRMQYIGVFDKEENRLETFEERLLGKSPCFSADNSKIAFITPTGNDNWGIQELDMATKEVRWLTEGTHKDYSPRYLHDGRLLFSSNREGTFKFYTLPPKQSEKDGAAPLRIYASNANIWDPRTSGSLDYDIQQKPRILGNARSSFGSIAVNGDVYVVGGHQGFEHTYPPESFSKEVHYYNQEQNSWTQLADKIHPVHGVTVAYHNGYLYAFGGFAYSQEHDPKWKSLSVIERYSIANNTWEVIGHLPEPRSSNAIGVVGDKVYLLGGWDATPKFAGDKDGTFHASVVEFDLNTQQARHADFSMPQPLRRAFTATVKDSSIYIGGGITQGGSHFNVLDEIWSIDPLEHTQWTQRASLPFANFAPAMMSLKGELYMFGGMKFSEHGYKYVNDIFKMNSSSQTWEHTGRYLSERKGFVQPVLLNPDTAGLLGGHTYDYQADGPVSTFESFKVK
ncbi:MAG: hypothetical protein CL677_09310 [Bdellovibrionaceae bacterium]|nr:hypothetical protein [Pseudobdellovibrionaceae bacterium]|tara:strand:+ start:169449 stop:171317 length:1869 start_codon:yes stop_codon:yes gene_type:complete